MQSRSLAHNELWQYARDDNQRRNERRAGVILTIGEKMPVGKVAAIAACVVVALTAACAEQSTMSPDIDARYLDVVNPFSPPPPPPVDTLGATLDSGSSSVDYFGVTLFMNRPGTTTWLMFDGEGATADARLQIGADGRLMGSGQLTLGGTQLALGSVSVLETNTLKACETPIVDTELTTDRIPDGKCGNLVLKFGERGERSVLFAIGVDTPSLDVR